MKNLVVILFVSITFFMSACSSNVNSARSPSGPPAQTDVSTGTLITHDSSGSANESGLNTEDKSFFYFSYDDSGSTAAYDLTEFYIQNGIQPLQSWGRSYEYLNAETFDHFNSETVGPFEISIGMYKSQINEFPLLSGVSEEDSIYSLGVNISGPTLTKEGRPNIVATILIDVSGSMSSSYATETRLDISTLLDVVKHGMKQMLKSLKAGDIINIVTFADDAEELLIAWEFDENSLDEFNAMLASLRTEGATNLNKGIEKAYRAAQSTFDSEKSNRVIILTDADANVGEVDPTIIAANTVRNGAEGIYFAGVGIGNSFNEAFLNELTDIGKGSYVGMISPKDGERIFNEGFVRFIDDAVMDVQFKLVYPISFTHLIEDSSAEQLSTKKNEVQTVNFAYNSRQFFLENFTSTETLEGQSVSLELSFNNASGQRVTQTLEKPMQSILLQGETQIKAATMVYQLAALVSGALSCDAARSSGFFEEAVISTIFERYRQMTEDFCNL